MSDALPAMATSSASGQGSGRRTSLTAQEARLAAKAQPPATQADKPDVFSSWQWDDADRLSGTLHKLGPDDHLEHIRVGGKEGRKRAIKSLRRLRAASPYVCCAPDARGMIGVHHAAANGDGTLLRALIELGGQSADARAADGTSAAAHTLWKVKFTGTGLTRGHHECLQFLRERTKTGAFERRQLLAKGTPAQKRRKKRRNRPRGAAAVSRDGGAPVAAGGAARASDALPAIDSAQRSDEPDASDAAAAADLGGAWGHGGTGGGLSGTWEFPRERRHVEYDGSATRGKLSGTCRGSKWGEYYANTLTNDAHKQTEVNGFLERREAVQLREWRMDMEKRTLGIIPGEPTSPDKRVTGVPVEVAHYPFRSGSLLFS